jgi:hypothetical protein
LKFAVHRPGNPPARRATLARVRGIDSFDPSRCLIFQSAYQQAPSGTQDSPVEASLRPDVPARVLHGASCGASHILYFEVLNTDHIEPSRQVGASLLDPIVAPVGLARFETSDRRFDPHASVRTAARSGKFALQPTQAPFLGDYESWNFEQFPGRQGSRHRYAPVDSHHLSVSRSRDRIRHTRERDMPPASGITRHAIRLPPLGHRARPTEPYPAHFRDPHLAYVTRDPTHIPLPATLSDNTETLVSPAFPPRRPPVRPIEEVCHGLLEITQGLLLHRLAAPAQPWMFRAGGSKLTRLFKVVGRIFPARPPILVLLNGKVPYIPGMRAVLQQDRFLFRRRCKSVSRHTNIIANFDPICHLLSALTTIAQAYHDPNDPLGL